MHWHAFFTLPTFQGGMQAVRENRYIILSKDFEKAYKKAIRKDDQEHDFYKWNMNISPWNWY